MARKEEKWTFDMSDDDGGGGSELLKFIYEIRINHPRLSGTYGA